MLEVPGSNELQADVLACVRSNFKASPTLSASVRTWFIHLTEAVMKLGHPIFGNIMIVADLAGVDALPLDRFDFKPVIARYMTPDKAALNLNAFDMGMALVRKGG